MRQYPSIVHKSDTLRTQVEQAAFAKPFKLFVFKSIQINDENYKIEKEAVVARLVRMLIGHVEGDIVNVRFFRIKRNFLVCVDRLAGSYRNAGNRQGKTGRVYKIKRDIQPRQSVLRELPVTSPISYIYPLLHSGPLHFHAIRSRRSTILSSFGGFFGGFCGDSCSSSLAEHYAGLPFEFSQGADGRDNSTYSNNYQPPIRPSWWRKGIVPIPCLLFGEIIIVCGFLLAGQSIRGFRWLWIPFSCFLVLLGIGLCMLFLGWLYYDASQQNPNNHDGLHSEYTVPRKYILTSPNLWGTVIAIEREAVMANILPMEKKVAVISALVEGAGIRQTERMTGVNRETIMYLGVRVGQGCAALLDRKMRGLSCRHLEFDELWGFIGKKERHVRPDDNPQLGDVWTFCAIDSDSKLVPSFKVGKRDHVTANAFVADVASRMANRVQISTDGLRAYVEAVEGAFGSNVAYAQIVKIFENESMDAEVIGMDKKAFAGRPDMAMASTSHVERLNGTTRLHMRRLTRLTYAFSKKFENFNAAVGLHFAYYNFVKRHNTLRMTPAMAAGIERNFWTVENLVEAAA